MLPSVASFARQSEHYKTENLGYPVARFPLICVLFCLGCQIIKKNGTVLIPEILSNVMKGREVWSEEGRPHHRQA